MGIISGVTALAGQIRTIPKSRYFDILIWTSTGKESPQATSIVLMIPAGTGQAEFVDHVLLHPAGRVAFVNGGIRIRLSNSFSEHLIISLIKGDILK